MKTINLEILTPFGKYFSGDVEQIQFHSDDFYNAILPNHTPIVSSVLVSKMILKIDGKQKIFAIGGGVINVTRDKTTLLINSIESKEEIDLERATKSKERAEKRLSSDEKVDIARAKAALERALNRINVYNS